MDARLRELARLLVRYSCGVTSGERVLIECVGSDAFPLVECLIEEVGNVGGLPFYSLDELSLRRAHKLIASPELFSMEGGFQLERMREMDCYIGIRATRNSLEESDAPSDAIDLYSREIMNRVHVAQRIPNTRWVVLRYPTQSLAQSAHMSSRAFEELFFTACTMDYSALSTAMDPLVSAMNKADRVRIVGKGTDLSFSIKDIPTVKCDGKRNIPDGECYSAPVKESVEGVALCNTPTVFEGGYYSNLSLRFQKGRIVEIDCEVGDREKLQGIFNRDDGARYIGEFSIGCNPFIHREILDTLFDEKIAGSFHLTPGNCYKEAWNGNVSEVHWDMVYRQTPECGGGEIWFDDRLIRKDGRFVVDELAGLNPESFVRG